MGLKDFNADLKSAKGTPFDGISDLNRGESEAHLVFRYRHERLPQPIEVHVLTQDVSLYPRNPSYLAFVSSDGVDTALADFIQGMSPQIRGKSIHLVLATISRNLSNRLDPETASESNVPHMTKRTSETGTHVSTLDDANEESSSGRGDSDFGDDDEYNVEDEFLLSDDPGTNLSKASMIPNQRSTLSMAPDSTSPIFRQKSDFRAALKAGFSVGFYDSSYHLVGRMCSLSVPVSHLGVPEEIMEAWHLAPADHLVLLMRFPGEYPAASLCLSANTMEGLIQFELGKSPNVKPSLVSARAAFGKAAPEILNPSSKVGGDFVPLYLFNSVPKLLEKDMPRLLRCRRDKGLSWIEALEHLQSISAMVNHGTLPATSDRGGGQNKSTINSEQALPSLLQQDHALSSLERLSIPLVAMECCLSLILRCGTYCVNCHSKMEKGYQSMRPYVCGRDLCLDHYFSLGLGPGIEHEIINNPYVVDLLISFFHAAVQSGKLRWFPKGLRLKAPAPEPSLATLLQARVYLNEQRGQLTADATDLIGAMPRLVEGERVVLFVRDETGATIKDLKKYLCRVDYVDGDSFAFEMMAVWERGLQLPSKASPYDPRAAGSDMMYLQRYTCELDDLVEKHRNISLLTMLCGIPSVLRIRQHLQDHPGQRLSQPHSLLDRYTYRLLFWIVSSNRSLILQDEPIKHSMPPSAMNAGQVPGESISGTNLRQNKVTGLNDDWMQFRFVQGSPEKERRFVQEISQVDSRCTPTLFAWHGSALGSWHGILSEGLNYAKREHGRAYGNGVYFSRSVKYSLTYSHGSTGSNPTEPWLYSELQIESAIGMCELANFPDKFISSHPHYVVSNLDWIQCRFLFVRYNPSAAAVCLPSPMPASRAWRGYITQDDVRFATGLDNSKVEIPASAIPSIRREITSEAQTKSDDNPRLDNTTSLQAPSAQASIPEGKDVDSVLGDDRETSVKRRRLGDRRTDFVPGTLNWNSLPKLPEPAASSAPSTAVRTLTRELREMHTMQENELHDEGDLANLGWYIDADRITNLLHWIVELHTFDPSLPIAQDMKKAGVTSIVLELRMGENYPLTPPFVRVVRPRFLTFQQGGGGHVTAGGAICSELLTNSGWLPSLGIEKVLLQVKLGLEDSDPPARLDPKNKSNAASDYGILGAVDAYKRAARSHGWSIPKDLDQMVSSWEGR